MKPCGLGHLGAAIAGFPFVKGRVTNAEPAADTPSLGPGFQLLQSPDALLFGKAATLHGGGLPLPRRLYLKMEDIMGTPQGTCHEIKSATELENWNKEKGVWQLRGFSNRGAKPQHTISRR